ncbi:TPA: Asp-tRNA(Asn)/Glu-tRNA(Gln) amidotransferase GatCAB subunit A [Candidatus Dependentiae bacterium]|nr:MAG: Glutamyl-tRNA(Gln) amidotransferase subunit A [candidate division TM6 bacterium GW2011_GWF2_43_87]HBL98844.1 Asp-tRNA(Asn)/Glu-tRNA(Gln) amidotransferase GatCAB subunit A [Candidatus Dependentiae bacterium]
MDLLAFSSVKELREKIQKKELSPNEVVAYSLKRIEAHNKKLNAVIEAFDSSSMDIPVDNSTLPLAGVPGLAKDVICQKDRITSCSSKILANFVPPYDATTVKRLKDAGASFVGRTNCDEFAMGASNETSAYGPVFNPWDLTRSSGGSGGGSAASVAAGLVPWALGTETGGSVRQPACFCGIVGSKPTYGLLSRYGLIAYGSSLDAVGINTRTVYDNALLMGIMAGVDERDSTSARLKGPFDYVKGLTGKIRPGLRIGVITNAVQAKGIETGVAKALDAALEELKKLGAELVDIALPTMDYGAAVYFMVSRAEVASNLSRFDGVRYGHRTADAVDLRDMYEKTRGEGFGHEAKRRILIGNFVLSAGHADQYYESACTVRRMMRAEMMDAFKKVDLLFAPVSAAPAFKVGELGDPLQMDLQDYFTCPANLANIPAVSVPCGFVDNMPVGFQLMGPDFAEGLIFETLHAYEQATPWHTMHPKGF